MSLYIPEQFKNRQVREVSLSKEDLLGFEERVKDEYEKGSLFWIRSPY